MKVPFHAGRYEKEVLVEKQTELGKFPLECEGYWPVHDEDGANKITNFELVLKFTDLMGNVYRMEEEIND